MGVRGEQTCKRQITASPGRDDQAEGHEQGNEPGLRARSRSKAITRRRAQDRIDKGLPLREEEQIPPTQEDEDDETVELGDADFGTDSPSRVGGWRHGGNKQHHEERHAEPDAPVSLHTPGVARPGEGRLRVVGDDVVSGIPTRRGPRA